MRDGLLFLAAAASFVAHATGATAPPLHVLPKVPDDLERYASPAFATCLRAAHGTRDTELCSLAERDEQVRALGAVYRKVLAASSPPRRARLIEEQAAWARASDADCNARSRPGRWGAIALVSCVRANAIASRLELERRAAR